MPDASLGVLRYPIAGSISLSLALRLLPFVDVADAIQYLVGIALLTLSVPEGPGRWWKGAR